MYNTIFVFVSRVLFVFIFIFLRNLLRSFKKYTYVFLDRCNSSSCYILCTHIFLHPSHVCIHMVSLPLQLYVIIPSSSSSVLILTVFLSEETIFQARPIPSVVPLLQSKMTVSGLPIKVHILTSKSPSWSLNSYCS